MKKQIIIDYEEYLNLLKETKYLQEKIDALIDTMKKIDGTDNYIEIHNIILELNNKYPMWL